VQTGQRRLGKTGKGGEKELLLRGPKAANSNYRRGGAMSAPDQANPRPFGPSSRLCAFAHVQFASNKLAPRPNGRHQARRQARWQANGARFGPHTSASSAASLAASSLASLPPLLGSQSWPGKQSDWRHAARALWARAASLAVEWRRAWRRIGGEFAARAGGTQWLAERRAARSLGVK